MTGYIPANTEAVSGYKLIASAYRSKTFLYIERHLSNGDVKAGATFISSFSDQVQGSGYVQYQASFEGHDAPDFDYLVPRTDIVSNPPPDPDPIPPSSQLLLGGKLLTDWVL